MTVQFEIRVLGGSWGRWSGGLMLLLASLCLSNYAAAGMYKCKAYHPDGSTTTTFSQTPCSKSAQPLTATGAKPVSRSTHRGTDRDNQITSLLSVIDASIRLDGMQELLEPAQKYLQHYQTEIIANPYEYDRRKQLRAIPMKEAHAVYRALRRACEAGSQRLCAYEPELRGLKQGYIGYQTRIQRAKASNQVLLKLALAAQEGKLKLGPGGVQAELAKYGSTDISSCAEYRDFLSEMGYGSQQGNTLLERVDEMGGCY